jgi:hypothetical protein
VRAEFVLWLAWKRLISCTGFDVSHSPSEGIQMKAFVYAAVLALATPFVFAQDKMQPLAAAAETIKVSAKVIAVDQTDRLVGLQMPDGSEVVIVAGPEVRNLAQVKVGDTVNAEYQAAAVISLKKFPGLRGSTEATSCSDDERRKYHRQRVGSRCRQRDRQRPGTGRAGYSWQGCRQSIAR